MDPLSYVLANAALTLDDHLVPGGSASGAAHAALTRRTGQPGALTANAADQWADPVAAIHTHLTDDEPPDRLDVHDLPELPLLDRYQRCQPSHTDRARPD